MRCRRERKSLSGIETHHKDGGGPRRSPSPVLKQIFEHKPDDRCTAWFASSLLDVKSVAHREVHIDQPEPDRWTDAVTRPASSGRRLGSKARDIEEGCRADRIKINAIDQF